MIDLHCHLLWGMDDGSKSIDESLGLMRLAVKNSINAIVATPHFNDYYNIEGFVRERENKAETLRFEADARKINIGIGTGAELFLCDDVFAVDDFKPLSINESRYVLCEYQLPLFDPKYAVLYAGKIFEKGFIPLIAHPERYKTFHENRWIVDELLDMGALFQVNVPSLAGKGGETIKDFATDLVLSGKVTALGTDAHSPDRRTNDFIACRQMFDERISDELVEKLTVKNSYKIISDKNL